MARSSDAVFPLSLIRDKTFQHRQIRRVLMLTLFFIVQSTIVLGIFYHQFLGDLVSGNAPMFLASEDMVKINESVPPVGHVLTRWLLVMLLINTLVSLGLVWFIIRKLGNPLLAINRALREMGEGNLSVRLREGDQHEFKELCDALNGALESVNAKITQAQAFTSIVEKKDNQPPPDEQSVRHALTACHQVLNQFQAEEGLRASNASYRDSSVGGESGQGA